MEEARFKAAVGRFLEALSNDADFCGTIAKQPAEIQDYIIDMATYGFYCGWQSEKQ